MRRGIVMLVWLLAAALLAACGSFTEAGPTLTAMSDAVRPSDTPVPASATPEPATDTAVPAPDTPVPPTGTAISPSETPPPPAGGRMCRGRIAFIRRDAGSAGIYTVQADGSGLTEVVADPGSTYSLSWSPDGEWLAYAAQKDGSYGVYLVDSGGQLRRLDVGGYGSEFSWSPDGEAVVLNGWEGLGTELYVVVPGGGEPRQLTTSASHKTGPAWSPDGGWIAFTMLDAYNQGDVWVMPAPGGAGEPVNLTQHAANDCCLAWSPDSARLAFLSSRADEGARPAGILVPVSYGAPRPLMTVVPKAPQDVYLVARDGSGLRNLTGDPGREWDLAWSPDGGWLAYTSDRDGGKEVYLLDVDGGEQVRLTENAWSDFAPVWSPDGACLAFVSYREEAYGIYLLTVPPEPGAAPGEAWKLVDGGTGSGGLDWIP